jgi:hypothetical protein
MVLLGCRRICLTEETKKKQGDIGNSGVLVLLDCFAVACCCCRGVMVRLISTEGLKRALQGKLKTRETEQMKTCCCFELL